MARRVRQSVKDQAVGSAQSKAPPVDFKDGAEYALPTSPRSTIFLFFEFGLFFAAGMAMVSVDQVIAAVLFAIAVGLPLVMFYYDGRSTPRRVVIYEDHMVVKFKFRQPVEVYWEDIEFLQRIEVFERFSSRSKNLGWMKSKKMKSPVVLSFKAGEAAIYAYTKKMGSLPPEKLVEKESARKQ